MPKKPAMVTFERLIKETKTLNNLIDRGIKFDGLEGKTTQNHADLELVLSQLDSVKERIVQAEKEYIVSQIADLVTPLMEKAGGDMELVKELISKATSEVNVQNNSNNYNQNH